MRLTGGGGTSPGDNFDGENFVRGKLCHTSSFDAGPSDTGGKIIGGKFRHTPNPWFLVDKVEFLGLALYLFRCALGFFFAVAPHSFLFITGAHVITYSCPTSNGWKKK